MILPPRDRKRVAQILTRKVSLDFGEFEVDSEPVVYLNYRKGNRLLRVLRNFGRHIAVFQYTRVIVCGHPEYNMLFLHKDGSLVEFPKLFQGGGYEQKMADWLGEQGAEKFEGSGWHERMAVAMDKLARSWSAPQ